MNADLFAYIVGTEPDYCMTKIENMACLLLAYQTRSRVYSALAVTLADISSDLLPEEEGETRRVSLSIRMRRQKNGKIESRTVTLSGKCGPGIPKSPERDMDAVYWIVLHLRDAHGVDLSNVSSAASAYADGTIRLFSVQLATMEKRLMALAAISGYSEKRLSVHYPLHPRREGEADDDGVQPCFLEKKRWPRPEREEVYMTMRKRIQDVTKQRQADLDQVVHTGSRRYLVKRGMTVTHKSEVAIMRQRLMNIKSDGSHHDPLEREWIRDVADECAHLACEVRAKPGSRAGKLRHMRSVLPPLAENAGTIGPLPPPPPYSWRDENEGYSREEVTKAESTQRKRKRSGTTYTPWTEIEFESLVECMRTDPPRSYTSIPAWGDRIVAKHPLLKFRSGLSIRQALVSARLSVAGGEPLRYKAQIEALRLMRHLGPRWREINCDGITVVPRNMSNYNQIRKYKREHVSPLTKRGWSREEIAEVIYQVGRLSGSRDAWMLKVINQSDMLRANGRTIDDLRNMFMFKKYASSEQGALEARDDLVVLIGHAWTEEEMCEIEILSKVYDGSAPIGPYMYARSDLLRRNARTASAISSFINSTSRKLASAPDDAVPSETELAVSHAANLSYRRRSRWATKSHPNKWKHSEKLELLRLIHAVSSGDDVDDGGATPITDEILAGYPALSGKSLHEVLFFIGVIATWPEKYVNPVDENLRQVCSNWKPWSTSDKLEISKCIRRLPAGTMTTREIATHVYHNSLLIRERGHTIESIASFFDCVPSGIVACELSHRAKKRKTASKLDRWSSDEVAEMLEITKRHIAQCAEWKWIDVFCESKLIISKGRTYKAMTAYLRQLRKRAVLTPDQAELSRIYEGVNATPQQQQQNDV